ncbi:MAG: glycosyl transferase family 2 [Proteobacteria bacterium]|nr:glycosyl transferase family 2 [Pseudomonadota bacterium]
MHRDRLALQQARLEREPGWSGVGCHVRLFPRRRPGPPGPRPGRDGRAAYERWLNAIRTPEAVVAEAFVECPLAHPTWMLRRSAFEAFGYRDCGWPEDYDLLLRLLGAGHVLGVVPKRLVGWRDAAGRLSRTDPTYGLDRFAACKAAHLAAGLLRDQSEFGLWGYGHTGRALCRSLAAHGRRPAYIVELHPGRLGQRIRGAPVVAPEALPEQPRRPLLVSVAGAGPRAEIRAHLAGMGFCEGRDFVCAA